MGGKRIATAALLLVAVLVVLVSLRWRERLPAEIPAPPVNPLRPDGEEGIVAAPASARDPDRSVAPEEGRLRAGPPAPAVPEGTEEAGRLVVHVLVQGSDEPIPEAEVTLTLDGSTIAGRTDEEGDCVLELPGRLPKVAMLVEKPGFFHAKGFWGAAEEATFRLFPSATLAGRILAADTKAPLPGARVSMPHGFCKDCEAVSVVADAEGRYELPGVPVDSPFLVFRVEVDGFPKQVEHFRVDAGQDPYAHDFLLDRGVLVHGRVVDLVSGIGVAGAVVEGEPVEASGDFRVRVAPPWMGDSVELHIEAPGYVQLWAPFSYERLREGEALHVPLPRCAVVEGVVRDEAGEPVAGARVVLAEDALARARSSMQGEERTPLSELPPEWRWNPLTTADATTDADGRFAIENAVPWQAHWTVRTWAEGLEPGKDLLERTPPPGERARVEIGLARSENAELASVSGGITINGSPGRFLGGTVRWSSDRAHGEAPLRGGSYALETATGRIRLEVEVDGLPPELEGDSLTLELEGGEKRIRSFDLVVPSAPITGRVLSGGEPLSREAVRASCSLVGTDPADWRSIGYDARTDDEGRYVLPVPDWEHDYRVEVHHAGEVSRREHVPAGASGVDFHLPASGTIRLRVREPDTARVLPLGSFALSWRRFGEGAYEPLDTSSMGAPDGDGWSAYELPRGPIDLVLAPRGLGSTYRPLTVEAVLVTSVPNEVELVAARGLELALVLASAEPIPRGHTLLLIEEEHWAAVSHDAERNSWTSPFGMGLFRRAVRFEEDRTCSLVGLPPGRLRFKSFPDDLVLEPETIDLSPSGPASVEVRWRSR